MTSPERLTHDEEGRVLACPACDKAGDIIVRRAENTFIGDPDDYACGNCGETFDEPVDREEKISGGKAKYADLSPADVGLEETNS